MVLLSFVNIHAQEGSRVMYSVYDSRTYTLYLYYDNLWESRGVKDPKLYTNTNYEKLSSVIIDPSFADARPTSTAEWFKNCDRLYEIKGLEYLNTSEVTDMHEMFMDCYNLKTITDLSIFDTSKVTTMKQMFFHSGCRSMDMSKNDLGNVVDMSFMFCRSSFLKNINFGNSTTVKLKDLTYFLADCGALTEVNLNGLETSQVTSMEGMFEWCFNLKEIDLSTLNTENLENMGEMFSPGDKAVFSKLETIKFGNFNTKKVTDMSSLFAGCQKLTNIDLSNFDTGNVLSMRGMFLGCTGLTSIDVSHFDTRKVEYMEFMFSKCTGLTEIDLSNFDTRSLTNMRYMFEGCTNLENIDLNNFDTSNVTEMTGLFYGCSHLTNLHIDNFDTKNVTDFDEMFKGCNSLTKLDLSFFVTYNAKNMTSMFEGCTNLKSLDVSSFETSKISLYKMFKDCKNLERLNMIGITIYKWGMDDFLSNCVSLKSIVLGKNISDIENKFTPCINLREIVIFVEEPMEIPTWAFREDVFANATLYVLPGLASKFSSTAGWNGFKNIKEFGLTGSHSQSDINFEDMGLNEETDLNFRIIDNVFFNISSRYGGFNNEEKCVVVNRAISEDVIERIVAKDIYENDNISDYIGIMVKIPEGKGSINIKAKTEGNFNLCVKIGSGETQSYKIENKAVQSIHYDVNEDTYLYIFASENPTELRYFSTFNELDSCLKLYGIEISNTSSGITNNIFNSNYSKNKVFDLNGSKVKTPKKGIIIMEDSNGAYKKVTCWQN